MLHLHPEKLNIPKVFWQINTNFKELINRTTVLISPKKTSIGQKWLITKMGHEYVPNQQLKYYTKQTSKT